MICNVTNIHILQECMDGWNLETFVFSVGIKYLLEELKLRRKERRWSTMEGNNERGRVT